MRTDNNSGFSKYHKERNGNTFYLTHPEVRQPEIDVVFPHDSNFDRLIGWQSSKEMYRSMPEHLTLHDIWGDEAAHYVPDKVLEIGCGLGRCSVWMQKYHGWPSTEWWLLDGTGNDINYGMDNGETGFYNDMALTQQYFEMNCPDAKARYVNTISQVEADDLDLVMSFMAFGFHWPLNDYLEQVTHKCNPEALAIFGTRGYDKGGSRSNLGGRDARKFVNKQIDGVNSKYWRLIRDARMSEATKSSVLIFERTTK